MMVSGKEESPMFAMKDGKGGTTRMLTAGGSKLYRSIDFLAWVLRAYVIIQLVFQALRMARFIMI